MRLRHRTIRLALTGLVAIGLATTAAPGSGASAGPAAKSPVTRVNECWSSDNGNPVLDSVDVSPAAIDTDAGPVELQITVQAHDTGGPGPATGIRQVRVYLSPGPDDDYHGPGTGRFLQAYLTSVADGSWHGTVTVPALTRTTYRTSIGITDGADVGTLSTALTFDQNQSGGPVATVTATSASTDSVKPSLTALTLSDDRVDTRTQARQVTVEATTTDDDAGVDKVDVEMMLLERNKPVGARVRVGLERVAGTDRFRGQVPFTRWLGNHQEALNVYVTDRAGNYRRYRPPVLASHGLPSRITVVSGPLNHVGPRIVQVQRAARSVDVRRQSRWYPIRVVLADTQGVRSARINLPDQGRVADLHRVSGTALRGTWIGRLRFARCTLLPSAVRLNLDTIDAQGVHGSPYLRTVRLVSRDFTTPWPRTHWQELPRVFTFPKPVHGISSDNVVVTSDYYSDPVAGTWTCRDPKGRRIDCLTGPVTKATFTVDDPSGGGPGIVDWAPEHHLDVLDAHGNPADISVAPYVAD